ncbi:MAG: hypothetical protein ACOZHQ_04195 [Thermodesulfobacteriota bacterium]
MRRKAWWLGVLALTALILAGGPVPAEAAGARGAGPGLVPAGRFEVGLSAAWLSLERFQDTRESFREADGETGSEPSTNLKIRNDRTYMVNLTYGLTRWLSLRAGLGLVEGGSIQETLSNGNWEAKLKSHLVWGLGARALVWEGGPGLGLTAGLGYLRYDDRGIKYWQYPNGGNTSEAGVGVDGQVDYWRVEADLRLHWSLGRWRPFVGGAYAYSEITDKDRWSYPDGGWSRYDFASKSADRWGLLGGLEAEIIPGLNLIVQGMLLAREEIGLSLSYDF